MAASAAVALAFCAWLATWYVAIPIEVEEWSALLGADTFAHGKLANGAHPLSKHFERSHILLEPTYVSELPPLPGMALAVGQWLGEPLIGSALVFALAAATLHWMLIGWGFSTWWALSGAICVAVHPQIAAFWGIGYLSGGTGLLGGALVYGALPRMRSAGGSASRAGFALGMGAVVLLLSGPYLALVACLPVCFVLARDLVRSGSQPAAGHLRAQLRSAGVITAVGLAFLAYYNYRTTGDPLKTPHQAYVERYATAPDFLLQAPLARPVYTNPSMPMLYRENGRMNAPYYDRQHLTGFVAGIGKKIAVYGGFLFPLPLLLLLAPLPFLRRDPKVRFAVAAFVFFGAALSVQTFEVARFVAPFVALGSIPLLMGLREITRLSVRGIQFGAALPPLILIPAWGIQYAQVTDLSIVRSVEPLVGHEMMLNSVARFQRQDHLVLVRYGNGHAARWEWLINEADIDGAHVVFALELDEESNRKLLDYFPDREPWRLRSTNGEISIVPFGKAKEWRTAATSTDDS